MVMPLLGRQLHDVKTLNGMQRRDLNNTLQIPGIKLKWNMLARKKLQQPSLCFSTFDVKAFYENGGVFKSKSVVV